MEKKALLLCVAASAFSEKPGIDGLKDKPRKALSHPNKTSEELVSLVLALKKRKPLWGPKKFRELLKLETGRGAQGLHPQGAFGRLRQMFETPGATGNKGGWTMPFFSHVNMQG